MAKSNDVKFVRKTGMMDEIFDYLSKAYYGGGVFRLTNRPLYDIAQIPAAGLAAGSILEFFNKKQGAASTIGSGTGGALTLADTNMLEENKLPQGTQYVMQSMQIIPLANPALADLLVIYAMRAWLQLDFDTNPYTYIPLHTLPSGVGFTSASANPAYGGSGGAYSMKPQQILFDSQQNFSWKLNIPSGIAALPGAAAVNVMMVMNGTMVSPV